MKKQMKSIVALFSICAVIAILLAATNVITAPTIKKNEDEAATKAMLEVLPNGEDFKSIDISNFNLPSSVKEVYCEKNGGYIFKMATTGFSSGMVILCGVNPNGTVSGAVCLASSETLGYEKTFGESLKGVDANTVGTVDTISGATKTTEAYRSAVRDALTAFSVLGGNSHYTAS